MVNGAGELIDPIPEHDAAATVADGSEHAASRRDTAATDTLRHVVKQSLRSGLKAAAAAVDVVRPPQPGLVVLLYHQVDGAKPSGVNLSRSCFAEQLRFLSEHGGIASLDAGVAAVRRGGGAVQGSRPRIAVTFDDGTADFADVAVPLLVEHGIPATLYLATRWVDEGRSFWDDGTVLSWAALRDVLATGLITIGSHTHSHVLLDRSPPAVVADELDRSIGLIEDNLGVTPHHFAYPKALRPSPDADLAVRARFRSAAIAGTRPNPYGATDPVLLHRSPIQVADGMVWFRKKVGGGLAFEDELREVVNRRRYAGVTR